MVPAQHRARHSRHHLVQDPRGAKYAPSGGRRSRARATINGVGTGQRLTKFLRRSRGSFWDFEIASIRRTEDERSNHLTFQLQALHSIPWISKVKPRYNGSSTGSRCSHSLIENESLASKMPAKDVSSHTKNQSHAPAGDKRTLSQPRFSELFETLRNPQPSSLGNFEHPAARLQKW